MGARRRLSLEGGSIRAACLVAAAHHTPGDGAGPGLSAAAGSGVESHRAWKNRRWYRYSLRSLLLVTLAAALVSWHIRSTLDGFEAEHATIAELRQKRAVIKTAPAEPQWLWRLFPRGVDSRCQHAIDADLGPIAKPSDDVVRMAGRLKHLEQLSVNSDAITDEAFTPYSALTRLKNLSLTGNFLTERALWHLTGAKNLRGLSLNCPRIGNEAVDVLEHFFSLRALEVNHTTIDDGGMPRMARLCGLAHLHLPPTVSPAGLRYLSSLEHLRHFGFYFPAGQPPDALSVLREFPELEDIRIFGSGLRDADLGYIAEIPHLKTLSIHGGHLTIEGVAALKVASDLRSVSFHDAGIDRAAQSQLKALLPHVTSVHARIPRRPSPRPPPPRWQDDTVDRRIQAVRERQPPP